jgi:serine/threonine protein kinase
MAKTDDPGQPAEIQADTLVGAGYRLVRRLGRGAFGEVWQAEAPGGVPDAVKIISRSLTEKEAQAEGNALELTKKLRHGYLLQTQAFWAVDDRLFIVMELADGSLRDRFRECQAQGLPGIPVGELLPCIEQAAAALDYLHENRLLHRDIKPENILRLGKLAKVADFGLAVLLPETVRSVTVNSAGTIPYMGPEVWHGKACNASDQWSLAVTYVELRRGRPLFGGSNQAEMMFNILNGTPDLAGLEGAEQDVLRTALAKEHAHRFATCSEFADALRLALAPYLPTRKSGGGKSGPKPVARGETQPPTPSSKPSYPPPHSAAEGDVKTNAGAPRVTGHAAPVAPPAGEAAPPGDTYDTLAVAPSAGPAKAAPLASPATQRSSATQTDGSQRAVAPSQAPPGPPPRPAPARKRKSLLPLLLTGLAAVAVGVGIGAAVWLARPPQNERVHSGATEAHARIDSSAPTGREAVGPVVRATERRQDSTQAERPRETVSTERPRDTARQSVPPVATAPEIRTYAVVCLHNTAGEELQYRYRWSTEKEWKDGTLAGNDKVVHDLPLAAGEPLPTFVIEVKSANDTGKGTLEPEKWTGKGRPTYKDCSIVHKIKKD